MCFVDGGVYFTENVCATNHNCSNDDRSLNFCDLI